MARETGALDETPTWVVAVVCAVIVSISIFAERALHRFGKYLKNAKQEALFEALQKLKEELMLLGFISLLLTVSQSFISHMCIPIRVASRMLPCRIQGHRADTGTHEGGGGGRKLLSTPSNSHYCTIRGGVPMFSVNALHDLHIFIFVLAVIHVIFCATTMALGGAKIRQWKHWERSSADGSHTVNLGHRIEFLKQRTVGNLRRTLIGRWIVAFTRQFYGSITKLDYLALRHGFIMTHCPRIPNFDFNKYMMRTLEDDFRKIVGISWYLWLFAVIVLLLNVGGWHAYFWLSFLPVALEHIISEMAEEVVSERQREAVGEGAVKPSDSHFWFGNPNIVLYLIHFILFQNAFEIAFFFFVLCTYGFKSCLMERGGYVISRLISGVMVQVICSYSTLPLYALVSQMGSMFKRAMFEKNLQDRIEQWVVKIRDRPT